MEYVVCGQESGEVKAFKTLKEAREFIKELKKKKFDKRNGINGIKDNYYIAIIEEK